ncbi:MAG TPA: hypothetical protein VGD77_04930 [Gemmatimonadaceae bacterium]
MADRRPTVLMAALLLLAAGCGGKDTGAVADSTVSQRQRDSAVANSGLPGSQGVGRAMQLQDSQASRNAQLDSLASQP